MPNTEAHRRPDAMTVRADYLAFRDLKFGLSNTFSITDVKRLFSENMVELKRDRMRIITAIYTTFRDLEFINPVTNMIGSLFMILAHTLPIARLFVALFPIMAGAFSIVWAALFHAVLTLWRTKSRCSFCFKVIFADFASAALRRRIFPRWHNAGDAGDRHAAQASYVVDL